MERKKNWHNIYNFETGVIRCSVQAPKLSIILGLLQEGEATFMWHKAIDGSLFKIVDNELVDV